MYTIDTINSNVNMKLFGLLCASKSLSTLRVIMHVYLCCVSNLELCKTRRYA